jgi:hypothetical protein
MSKVVLKSSVDHPAKTEIWAKKLLSEGQLQLMLAVKAKSRKFVAEEMARKGIALHERHSISFDEDGLMCVELDNEKAVTLFLLQYSK